MNLAEKFVVGIVTIGLVTAFGLHARDLATLATSVGKAGSQIEGSAITGNAPRGK